MIIERRLPAVYPGLKLVNAFSVLIRVLTRPFQGRERSRRDRESRSDA
jgi:hypothetical protein